MSLASSCGAGAKSIAGVSFTCLIICLISGLMLAAGCGPPGGDGEDMDSDDVRSRITEETSRVTERLESAIRFAETEGLLHRVVEWMGAYENVCAERVDREGNQTGADLEDGSCEWVIDTDLKYYADQINDLLDSKILVDANVSSSSPDSVVYLLDGRTVCLDDADGEAAGVGPGNGDATEPLDKWERECVEATDRAQWRIRVTSPGDEALDAELYVGPDRLRTGVVKIRPANVAVQVDLQETRKAIRFVEETYAAVEGRDIPEDSYIYKLPDGLSGVVEAAVSVEKNEGAAFDVSLRRLNVSGNGFGVSIPTNTPIFSATVDGRATTVSASVSLPAFTAAFPITLSIWDPEAEASKETDLDVRAHTAGLELQVRATQKTGLLELRKLTLGHGKKHWLEVDGERIAEASAGGTKSGKITGRTHLPGGSSVNFSTSTGVIFNTLFSLEGLEQKLNPDRWMLDGQLKGKATAGAEAVLEGGYLSVTKGRVSFADDKAGIQRSVPAGQCLDPEAPSRFEYYHPIEDIGGTEMCGEADGQ